MPDDFDADAYARDLGQETRRQAARVVEILRESGDRWPEVWALATQAITGFKTARSVFGPRRGKTTGGGR